MDTRNRSFILPFLIGILSLFGLCSILALVFLPKQTVKIVPTRTPTPFQYRFLGTETPIPTPIVETGESRVFPTETSEDVETPDAETTPFFLATKQDANPTAGSSTPTPTITSDPVFGNSGPLTPGRYDDSSPGFTYIGVWNAEEDSYAYQETVHTSDEVDDYAAFSFTGSQLMLGYQNSFDAGEITVEIDGLEETTSQRVGSIWFSYDLEPGTHHAIITHTSDGPINIDYIEISE